MVEHAPKQKEDPLPRRIEPMLSATAARIPKDNRNWISELYFPGMRIIAHIDKNRGISLMTRQNDNVVENFPEIFKDLWELAHKKSMILDGCIVCVNGHSSPKAAEIKAKQTSLQQKRNPIGPCYFVVNDVLYANGQNLTGSALEKRKRVLDKLIPDKRGTIVPVPYSDSDHKSTRRIARNLGVREVIYRKKNSVYKQGSRSKEWVRVKVRTR